MRKNPIVKDLHNVKYRKRVVPNKKPIMDDPYDWINELYEDDNGTTSEADSRDQNIQPDDTRD
jgi:hypothetical protein